MSTQKVAGSTRDLQAVGERTVAVQGEDSKIDVVTRERASEKQHAERDALVLGSIGVLAGWHRLFGGSRAVPGHMSEEGERVQESGGRCTHTSCPTPHGSGLWMGGACIAYATSIAEAFRKRRMPFGEDDSKVRRCALLYTSSAYSLSSGVVT